MLLDFIISIATVVILLIRIFMKAAGNKPLVPFDLLSVAGVKIVCIIYVHSAKRS